VEPSEHELYYERTLLLYENLFEHWLDDLLVTM
jgi:hypothetical protein